MPYTRRQIVISVSIIYLIFVAGLAAYGLSRTNRFSIPISNVLSSFTTALPVISGLLLGGGYELTRLQERHRGTARGQKPRPPFITIANTITLIYSTVVMTLLGTHAAPASGLRCGLEDTWQRMFSQKDETIKTIQDAFNCCGFVKPHDRAWPFPAGQIKADACEKSFKRTKGCLEPWKKEEQNVASLFMSVVGLVFIWQFAMIVIRMTRDSWLNRVLPGRVSRDLDDEGQGSSNRPRRRINYLPDFNRYTDNTAEEASEEDIDDTPRRAIGGGANGVGNALAGVEEGEEDARERAIPENAWSRT